MNNYLSVFFIGTLAALAVLALEYIFLILFFSAAGSETLKLIAVSVFLEEAIKFFLLFKITKEKNSPFIFLASILFGVGFSLAEIGLNLFSESALIKNTSALAYILLIHLLTCALFGYVLARYQSKIAYFFVLSLAFALHLFFNFFILRELIGYNRADIIFFLFLTVILVKFAFSSSRNLSLPN